MVIFGVTGNAGEKAHVGQHRVTVGSDAAIHFDALGLGLNTVELNGLLATYQTDAAETGEKIEMPPGATKLAIGHDLETAGFLLAHDRTDTVVFDHPQTRRIQLLGSARRTGCLEACGPPQAVDLIGTCRQELGDGHEGLSVPVIAFGRIARSDGTWP